MQKRMLNLNEAATYSGVPRSRFRAVCPVAPVEISSSRKLWDLRDLDRWLDTLGAGPDQDLDQIIARLA